MSSMHCVVKTAPAPGHLALAQRPRPAHGPGDILVKVLASAICGTDVHIQQWEKWAADRVQPPMIIGHEFAGTVVAVGSEVTQVRVGDLVSAETHIVCNRCTQCRTGNENVCPQTSTIGVHRDGSFAEYIAFPAENAFVCPPETPAAVASLMEPLGAAVHAALEFPLAGRTVAVMGCGPIGLMAIAIAKMVGAARVFAVEPNTTRGAFAMNMGATATINPAEQDAAAVLRHLTHGQGVDVVLEFSGSIPAFQTALRALTPEGKMAAVGLPARQAEFDLAEFVYRGLHLKGIAGRKMYQTWHHMQGLLQNGLDISPIVTHTLPLENYQEGLRLMQNGECCKTVLML